MRTTQYVKIALRYVAVGLLAALTPVTRTSSAQTSPLEQLVKEWTRPFPVPTCTDAPDWAAHDEVVRRCTFRRPKPADDSIRLFFHPVDSLRSVTWDNRLLKDSMAARALVDSLHQRFTALQLERWACAPGGTVPDGDVQEHWWIGSDLGTQVVVITPKSGPIKVIVSAARRADEMLFYLTCRNSQKVNGSAPRRHRGFAL